MSLKKLKMVENWLIYNKIWVPPLQGKEVAAKIIYYVEDILMLRSSNLA